MKKLIKKIEELGLNYSPETIAQVLTELELNADSLNDSDIETVIQILKQQSGEGITGGLSTRTESAEIESYEGNIGDEGVTLLELVRNERDNYSSYLASQISNIMGEVPDLAIQKAKELTGAKNLDGFRKVHAPAVRKLFTAS